MAELTPEMIEMIQKNEEEKKLQRETKKSVRKAKIQYFWQKHKWKIIGATALLTGGAYKLYKDSKQTPETTTDASTMNMDYMAAYRTGWLDAQEANGTVSGSGDDLVEVTEPATAPTEE